MVTKVHKIHQLMSIKGIYISVHIISFLFFTLQNNTYICTMNSFYLLACSTFSLSKKTQREDIFRALFGTTSTVAEMIWNNIEHTLHNNCKRKYLLWTLHFLKHYCTAVNNSIIWKVDKKTHSKWVWMIIVSISEMNEVSLYSFCFMFLSYIYCTCYIVFRTDTLIFYS